MKSNDSGPGSPPDQTSDEQNENDLLETDPDGSLSSRRGVLATLAAVGGLGLTSNTATAQAATKTWRADRDANGFKLFNLDELEMIEDPVIASTDGTPLELRLNGEGVLRLEPTPARSGANILGGHPSNAVESGVEGATISGGGFDEDDGASRPNEVFGDFGTVGGGRGNTVSSNHGTIGGGRGHEASNKFATIAGGGPSDPNNPAATNNRVFDDYGTIGGGADNRVGTDDGDSTSARFATVGGGLLNEAKGSSATVGGGLLNEAKGSRATVGGGSRNDATALGATVGGGFDNGATAENATVGGGNTNNAASDAATVGGGLNNDATGDRATVGGGAGNSATGDRATVGGGAGNSATGARATVGGGSGNEATGDRATVPGGNRNRASGKISFAAGRAAEAVDEGAVVFGDATDTLVRSQSDNEFRSQMPMFAPSFNTTSARAKKEAIEPVDTEAVLDTVTDIEVSTWEFKDDGEVRHMGPMAGEFADAFGLGDDEVSIATVDADGVALAGIQGLAERLDERDAELEEKTERIQAVEAENETLRTENEALRDRCEALESRLVDLEEAVADLAN